MRTKNLRIETPLGELVERLNTAFDYVAGRLVNRSEEVEAIKLCMLASGHVMLEGPPGVAKSLLARLAFRTITSSDPAQPIIFYRKQFMASTMAEEVFGPMNVKKFRENAEWEYNTHGMLPQAHFAYMDEIYRASDSLLPAMMGILNERTFHNGIVEMRCPLITAIATTNFITDRPELEAFHDRWLARLLVKPADSSSSRMKILELFLEDISEEDLDVAEPLSLTELKRLQRAVRRTQIPPLLKDLYEDLVSRYRANVGSSCYVSDRRYCEAVRLVQAAILLESSGDNYENPTVGSLLNAKYAILQNHSAEHVGALEAAIQSVIGSQERAEKEEPDISLLEEQVSKFLERYDDNLPEDKKQKMLTRIVEVLSSITNLSPDEQFTLPRNIERLSRVVRRLEELKIQIQNSISSLV